MTNEPVIYCNSKVLDFKSDDSKNILKSDQNAIKTINLKNNIQNISNKDILQEENSITNRLEDKLINNPSVQQYLDTSDINLLPKGGRIKRLCIIIFTLLIFYFFGYMKYIISKKYEVYSFCSIRANWDEFDSLVSNGTITLVYPKNCSNYCNVSISNTVDQGLDTNNTNFTKDYISNNNTFSEFKKRPLNLYQALFELDYVIIYAANNLIALYALKCNKLSIVFSLIMISSTGVILRYFLKTPKYMILLFENLANIVICSIVTIFNIKLFRLVFFLGIFLFYFSSLKFVFEFLFYKFYKNYKELVVLLTPIFVIIVKLIIGIGLDKIKVYKELNSILKLIIVIYQSAFVFLQIATLHCYFTDNGFDVKLFINLFLSLMIDFNSKFMLMKKLFENVKIKIYNYFKWTLEVEKDNLEINNYEVMTIVLVPEFQFSASLFYFGFLLLKFNNYSSSLSTDCSGSLAVNSEKTIKFKHYIFCFVLTTFSILDFILEYAAVKIFKLKYLGHMFDINNLYVYLVFIVFFWGFTINFGISFFCSIIQSLM